MRGAARKLVLSAVLAGAAGSAQALEYRSVGLAPAVLYDAPSTKGRKVFVAPPGMPVEVVLTYGDWTKVRDAAGDLAWIPSEDLSRQRTLVVSVPRARVHANPGADRAAPVFTAERGVLLDMLEPAQAGWIRVRHVDGLSGYVRASEVWGD